MSLSLKPLRICILGENETFETILPFVILLFIFMFQVPNASLIFYLNSWGEYLN